MCNVCMKVVISIKCNFGGSIDWKTHWLAASNMSDSCVDWICQFTIIQLCLDRESTFWVMVWSTNGVAEGSRSILALEQLVVVEFHVVSEVHRCNLFPN